MYDALVLDVGVRIDADGIQVPSQNGSIPDADLQYMYEDWFISRPSIGSLHVKSSLSQEHSQQRIALALMGQTVRSLLI